MSRIVNEVLSGWRNLSTWLALLTGGDLSCTTEVKARIDMDKEGDAEKEKKISDKGKDVVFKLCRYQ